MSEQISEKIAYLENLEFPKGLHGKIMRKLIFLKFRTPFFIITSLLSLNLFASGWHIFLNLRENGSIETMRLLFENFELGGSSFNQVYVMLQELFPISLISAFVFNLFLILYLGFLFYTYNKLIEKKINSNI